MTKLIASIIAILGIGISAKASELIYTDEAGYQVVRFSASLADPFTTTLPFSLQVSEAKPSLELSHVRLDCVGHSISGEIWYSCEGTPSYYRQYKVHAAIEREGHDLRVDFYSSSDHSLAYTLHLFLRGNSSEQTDCGPFVSPYALAGKNGSIYYASYFENGDRIRVVRCQNNKVDMGFGSFTPGRIEGYNSRTFYLNEYRARFDEIFALSRKVNDNGEVVGASPVLWGLDLIREDDPQIPHYVEKPQTHLIYNLASGSQKFDADPRLVQLPNQDQVSTIQFVRPDTLGVVIRVTYKGHQQRVYLVTLNRYGKYDIKDLIEEN